MTLGTADESGRLWVPPVYYLVAGYGEFFWVSSPEATHAHERTTASLEALLRPDRRRPGQREQRQEALHRLPIAFDPYLSRTQRVV